MYAALQQYLVSAREHLHLSPDRKVLLDALADYVGQKLRSGALVRLIFICTHNSRRSHFGQVWAQIAAQHYGVGPVECYSGGTETTACNPRTVAALERAGLRVQAISSGDNPVYLLGYAGGVNPVAAFSKIYDQAPNPMAGFAAVMTCSQAEENCPFIPGTEKRFSITYDDPKAADGTPAETAVYDERCRQIAGEMAYVFEQVALGQGRSALSAV